MCNGENSDLRKELDSIYTPLSVAKKEIWRRWNDKELRKKVEDFLGGDIPEVLKEFPRAVLSRQVMSPNFEAFHFLDLARGIELKPTFFEYAHDKFIAKNIDKYYLCRLSFYNSANKDDEKRLNKITKLKVIDFDHAEGKDLCDLQTVCGKNLVDFHHEIAYSLNPDLFNDTFDCSEYFERKGSLADKYYPYYLSLFLCHGVLFENYLLDDRQSDFTEEILLKNFRKVVDMFGIKPLIVHLGPNGEEDDLYWKYYPELVKGKINKK